MKPQFRIAILCGGPSLERGISLNSSRSVCDHLNSDSVEILPIYFDHHKYAYAISPTQLYSNTPSDFDFKLHGTGRPLNQKNLRNFLRNVDLVFPVIHGTFGEDGGLQQYLEKIGASFVGSGSKACKCAFHKYRATEFLQKHGFFTLPSLLLKSHHPFSEHRRRLTEFFKKHALRRVVIKPATGGSSIGVFSISTPEEALEKAHFLFVRRYDTELVVEPFCEGKEFTVIILQNRFGQPVAILPTEIETDYSEHQIFNFRKKYLPTRHVTYHCPPRFSEEIIEKIQIQAEQLFTLFGMRDFARFDGWLLKNGEIFFSDFNPISGMEQNSFLFQQSSQIGMSHRDLLEYVVKSACRRHKIEFPRAARIKVKNRFLEPELNFETDSHEGRKRDEHVKEGSRSGEKELVWVLFGGSTSERQVSLMSGTNVWLKLQKSEKFAPHPFLLDTKRSVWQLPYAYTLNHTAEEIAAMCERAKKSEHFLEKLKTRVREKLNLLPDEASEETRLPEKMTLPEFLQKAKKQGAFVFNALHGGMGEDGTLQRMLRKAGIPFNGSDEKASHLCMDKFATGQTLLPLAKDGIFTAPKKLINLHEKRDKVALFAGRWWKILKKEFLRSSCMVKPNDDGCSSGIVELRSAKDLEKYLLFIQKRVASIPKNTFHLQSEPIEMPQKPLSRLLFEKFVVTDTVHVVKQKLHWHTKSDWIEVTIGVLGEKGSMRALNPSITVTNGNVLSLEEKFQGGTGINITPPPLPYVSKQAAIKARARTELVAKTLGLEGYARIDAFLHVKTGELIIIEVNTLPGLTPSTVLFHQGLVEKPPLSPRALLEKIIELGYNKKILWSNENLQKRRKNLLLEQPLLQKSRVLSDK